tara:strand:- start:37741 stop:37962 length:222 start_codon:yes stop_codon:yes gene_type:complete
MINIKDILAEIAENSNKTKFYRNNWSCFSKYFDSEHQYQALIDAGKFKKIEGIIKEKSEFKFEEFEATLNNAK